MTLSENMIEMQKSIRLLETSIKLRRAYGLPMDRGVVTVQKVKPVGVSERDLRIKNKLRVNVLLDGEQVASARLIDHEKKLESY
jgi:hypothetical protein